MIPDPLRRRIKVPVRIIGSTIQPTDGTQLPEFKPDAKAELVFEASELKDPAVARELTAETVVTVLPVIDGDGLGAGVVDHLRYRGFREGIHECELRPDPEIARIKALLSDGEWHWC